MLYSPAGLSLRPPLDLELLKVWTVLPVLRGPPSLCFSMAHGEDVPFT